MVLILKMLTLSSNSLHTKARGKLKLICSQEVGDEEGAVFEFRLCESVEEGRVARLVQAALADHTSLAPVGRAAKGAKAERGAVDLEETR